MQYPPYPPHLCRIHTRSNFDGVSAIFWGGWVCHGFVEMTYTVGGGKLTYMQETDTP